jgi:hypothetical protein
MKPILTKSFLLLTFIVLNGCSPSDAEIKMLKELGFSNLKQMEMRILDGLSNAAEVELSSRQSLFEKKNNDFRAENYSIENAYRETSNSLKRNESSKLLQDKFLLHVRNLNEKPFKWRCEISSITAKEISCDRFRIKTSTIPNNILMELKAKQAIRFSGRLSYFEENYEGMSDRFFTELFKSNPLEYATYKVYEAKIITLNNNNFEKQIEINKQIVIDGK